ncbi:MAG TPA: VCBS repeat-containing protein, partial [Planctomycetaceae bacterium]|nr:VCBS repeat-containing protein [Planctomycetaceae bacterium]
MQRWFVLAMFVCLPASRAVAEMPRFEMVTIDPDIGKVCYAVSQADVNGDGKPDIVAVSENRIQWYENPSWTKHV